LSVVGFVILVDQDDKTDWFARANISDEVDFDGVSIYKDKTNSVGAVFKSGKKYFITDVCIVDNSRGLQSPP